MTIKCQHSGCQCEHDESAMIHRNGGYYCSEDCANDPLTTGCTCGHPDCTHPAT